MLPRIVILGAGRSGVMGGDLGGKAAVVTGGANGIGREIAPRLAAAGAAVLVADRDGAGAEALAGVIFEPEEAE